MSKICEKCGEKIPATIKVDGKKRNLCSRKFCLKCSPFGSKNKSVNPCVFVKRNPGEVFEAECKNHGITNFIVNSQGHRRCKKCDIERVTKARQKRKKEIVEFCGGKCVLCGYDKCIDALHFHHLDPSKKSFSLSSQGVRISLKESLEEIKKCIMVCANCHYELENEKKK